LKERRLKLKHRPFTFLETSSIPFLPGTQHQAVRYKPPNSYIVMSTKLTHPRLEQLNNPMWHNPMNSKQAKHQRPQLICYRAMKKKMIH